MSSLRKPLPGEIKARSMPWHHKYLGTPFLTALLHLFLELV
jgi:hypothetical protein